MRKAILVLCLTATIFLGGCDTGQVSAAPGSPHILELETPAETEPVRQYETCSFSDGLDRFIECYISCCMAYENANQFKDTGWDHYNGCWHYKQYEDIWTEPDFQIYIGDSGAIREIRIGYEDHGYTEWGEALSDERAFFVLRCLGADESDEEIHRLIAEEKSGMKENAVIVDPGETPEMIDPLAWGNYYLYHFFSGGVYYFCIRDSGQE